MTQTQQAPEDRLWSVDEVSYYLGVPANTLYLWRSEGEGRPHDGSGGTCGTAPRTSRTGWCALTAGRFRRT
jgi:hypothetical protein